jgi:hypothetical protein
LFLNFVAEILTSGDDTVLKKIFCFELTAERLERDGGGPCLSFVAIEKNKYVAKIYRLYTG